MRDTRTGRTAKGSGHRCHETTIQTRREGSISKGLTKQASDDLPTDGVTEGGRGEGLGLSREALYVFVIATHQGSCLRLTEDLPESYGP